MALKSLTFIGLFLLCAGGALFFPHLGIYGYIAEYAIGPSSQWWEVPLKGLGIRYSFTLAAATAIGILFNRAKLRYGESFLKGQEALLITFLALVWFSYLLGEQTIGLYTRIDHPAVKFAKVSVFLMMLTHVITDHRKLDGLLWVFVIVSLLLGLKAWSVPYSAYSRGRLEGIGGADFAEANFFAAFMASMLPLIGIQFLRSRWWGKALCAVSGAFTANAVVLCRSRGAFLGVAAGVLVAAVFAPKNHRKKIAVALVLGVLGGLYLSDEQFLERLTTITYEQEEMDASSMSRIRLWKAGAQMVADHPLGIGIGNWYQTIGKYIPEYEGKDAHNTYVKCVAELGVQGFLVYGFIIIAAAMQLWRVRKRAKLLPEPLEDDFLQFSFGLMVSLAIILACGLTITMIYTEIVWVLLLLPVCLGRALENALEDVEESASAVNNSEKAVSLYTEQHHPSRA
jgi:putative inorganic carbon (hco3(-)) transporter